MTASDHAHNDPNVFPCLKGGVHRWKAELYDCPPLAFSEVPRGSQFAENDLTEEPFVAIPLEQRALFQRRPKSPLQISSPKRLLQNRRPLERRGQADHAITCSDHKRDTPLGQ